MSQTTHRVDPNDGHLAQIVTPAELRDVLDADGDNYDRPADFGPADEWDTDDD